MRILVTGGAGFIGSNFVEYVAELHRDVEITVLDSLTYAGNLENLRRVNPAPNFIKASILDKKKVALAVSQSDLVVHFAAETHNDNSLRAPELFFETNVLGTLSVAEACRAFDVRLHHVSTDEVYGDLALDSGLQFTKDTPYRPSSPYSASKAASDFLIRSWVRSFGLRATLSNCGNNYGAKQHREKLIPNAVKRISQGLPPQLYGTGENIRDWIHVEDHVRGIWMAATSGAIGETYLFSARDRLSNRNLVKAIISQSNNPDLEIEYVNDRPGHDLKYAIDPSATEKALGWTAQRTSIIEEIPRLLSYYS